MHSRCPGAFRRPDGVVEACDCGCHHSNPIDLVAAAKGRLPVLDPSPEGQPAGGDSRPEKGQKEASKTPSRPGVGRRCECCGAGSRSRFLPGHDAKLKSKLFKQAKTGSDRAALELELRGWLRLVKYEQIPEPTLERALVRAKHVVREGRRIREIRDLTMDRIGAAAISG